jgi:P pilus assembly chaperone PapD
MKYIGVGGLLLMWLLSGVAMAQAGFQVEPPKLYFDEQTGKLTPIRIKLTNPTKVRMVIRASCADWRRDSLGEKQFFPPGKLPTSCCPYLRVQPETVELAPGGEQTMLVSLSPDQPVSTQLHNGMLMLTQINEREIAEAQGIKSGFIFKVQLGVHLYHTPRNVTLRTIGIDTVAVGKTGDGQQIRVRVNNTGALQLESHMRIELTNLKTAEEVKLDPVTVNSMPGERIWVKTPLPKAISAGRYLIITIIDSGPDVPLQVAELEADIR